MKDMEHIFQEIQRLPSAERRQLFERLACVLAEGGENESQTPSSGEEPSLIGLFADEPEAVDEMLESVMEERRRSKLRPIENDDEASAA